MNELLCSNLLQNNLYLLKLLICDLKKDEAVCNENTCKK